MRTARRLIVIVFGMTPTARGHDGAPVTVRIFVEPWGIFVDDVEDFLPSLGDGDAPYGA
jgi:hypothetical protein